MIYYYHDSNMAPSMAGFWLVTHFVQTEIWRMKPTDFGDSLTFPLEPPAFKSPSERFNTFVIPILCSTIVKATLLLIITRNHLAESTKICSLLIERAGMLNIIYCIATTAKEEICCIKFMTRLHKLSWFGQYTSWCLSSSSVTSPVIAGLIKCPLLQSLTSTVFPLSLIFFFF